MALPPSIRYVPSGVYLDAGIADMLRGSSEPDILIPGEAIRTKEGFLRAWAEAFRFPEWFGMNWDAFADIASDLSGLPSGDQLILYDRFDPFALASPHDWAVALQLLPRLGREWRSDPRQVVVMLRGPASLAPNLPLAFL